MNIRPSKDLPVKPDIVQLRHQAKDLLAQLRANDAKALQLHSRAHEGKPPSPKLSSAQFALARSYGVKSWPRLVTACRICDAIWRDDADAVLAAILSDPRLVSQNARGTEGNDNWGPPLSYAATAGAARVVEVLKPLDPGNVDRAFSRASLKGHLAIARSLMDSGAALLPAAVMGPCETLNPDGLEFLIALGAKIEDEKGDPLAPMALVLQTYTRNAVGKHRCMEVLAGAGRQWPDTPPISVHRGRLDLLRVHLARDPALFTRTWRHGEIYPRSVGCSGDPAEALHGTPLAGATLLHLAVDYDEFELLQWMLGSGADANAVAEVDAEGFGGHTALFGCVVSQPFRVGCRGHERFAELLLRHGADPTRRASLRKQLRFVADETMHEYRDVNCLEWAERFHDQDWVNPRAVALIRAAAG